MRDTSQILGSMKKCLRADNAEQLAELLRELIESEPERWTELLLIDSGLKDPISAEFLPQLRRVAEAFSILLDGGILTGRVLVKTAEILSTLTIFDELFTAVRHRLAAAGFYKEPWDTQQHRLVAFYESQRYLVMKDLFGGAHETSQDHVRYAYHSKSRTAAPEGLDTSKLKTPYEDPEFEWILRLAAHWLEYLDAWSRFKYLGWPMLRHPEDADAFMIAPRASETFLRSKVGLFRDGQHLLEFWANAGHLFGRKAVDMTPRVAASLTVPAAGTPWDGFVDYGALAEAVVASPESRTIALWIAEKLYSASTNRLRIESGRNVVTWTEWFAVMAVLRELASAFAAAMEDVEPDSQQRSGLRSVVVVRRDVLTNVVVSVTNLGPHRCRAVIDTMVFDANRRNLEIYDQPLPPGVDSDTLLFAPSLLRAGNAARTVEHFLAEWGDDSSNSRGSDFEDLIASEFFEQAPIKYAKRTRFKAGDGKTVEYDVLVWWDAKLFILECKFSRGVHSSADFWRAEKNVNEAIAQVRRRKVIALNEWQRLREKAPSLDLPDVPPAPDQIVGIVVTTVTHFTGQLTDDIFVIDSRCLERFFGDPNINAFTIESDGTRRDVGSYTTVRSSAGFVASEFLSYMAMPPQVAMIRNGLKLCTRWLPRLEESAPKIAVVDAEYSVPDSQLDDFDFGDPLEGRAVASD